MTNTSQKLDEKFFAKFNKELKYKKNQLIIGPGGIPSGVFFVKSGFVRQYLVSQDGKEITFNILKPNAYFSMISTLNKTPNIFYYESLTDVILLKAPNDEVVSYIENHPDILYDLTKRTLSGLDGITRLMQALLTGTAEQQIASVLLVLTRRFGKKNNKGIIIDIPVTHRIIGTLAGLSRESTSIELGKFTKANIISLENHLILVKNLRKLEDISPISYLEDVIS